MPQLIFSQQGIPLFRFFIERSTTKIGRSPDSDIMLADGALSRHQLVLYKIENEYLLKNIGKASLYSQGDPLSSLPLKDQTFFKIGNWEVLFTTEKDSQDWAHQETDILQGSIEQTQLLHTTRVGGSICAEKIQLKLHEPDQSPRIFPLFQETTVIGKNPTCDLQLKDPYCSGTHAKLVLKKGKAFLVDLNSTNGVFIDGVQTNEKEVEEESEVRIGQTVIKLEKVEEKKLIRPLEVDKFGPFVGRSAVMRELYSLIQQVAPTDATVCILGETGTGKELVARSVHELSPRKLKPWVALNCGAISKELIESELFGHEKGAFTGAHQQRQGAFEQAKGGTLFLDELGELPLELQPSLLRALETGKIRRVGGSQEISVDVRVVCATHRDLAISVQEGKFREDLFFRLYVFPIFLPPLRERKEDILLIAEHFLKSLSPSGRKIQFSKEAARFLELQTWKGNVRELKNMIQRSLILCRENEIQIEHLKLPNSSPVIEEESDPLHNSSNLQELEKQIILRELRTQGNNRLATAKALGIAKSTLYEKLKQYGVGEK